MEGKIEHAKGKVADTKARLKDEVVDRHSDDTEGGARSI